MEEWLATLRAVSVEVKVAWMIWGTWTVVQLLWYQHAKAQVRRPAGTARRPVAVPLKRDAVQHTTWSIDTHNPNTGSPELLAGLGLLPSESATSAYGAPMTTTERARGAGR